MIPKDEHIPVCREILIAVTDKLRQSVCIRHAFISCILFQQIQAVSLDLIDLVYAAAHLTVLPLRRSTGIEDQIDIVPDSCIQHLLNIHGCSSAAGFKIDYKGEIVEESYADIYHDRRDIISVA